jgi:hypothetical protein
MGTYKLWVFVKGRPARWLSVSQGGTLFYEVNLVRNTSANLLCAVLVVCFGHLVYWAKPNCGKLLEEAQAKHGLWKLSSSCDAWILSVIHCLAVFTLVPAMYDVYCKYFKFRRKFNFYRNANFGGVFLSTHVHLFCVLYDRKG